MTDILAANGNLDPVKLTNVLIDCNVHQLLHQHNVFVTKQLCDGVWSLQPDVARNAVASVPLLRDYLDRRRQAA